MRLIATGALLLAAALSPASHAVEDRFAAGDALFKGRARDESALGALAFYRERLKETPEDSEAAWRVAMACYFVGLRIEKDPDKKKALYEEGQTVGLAAAKRSPTCGPCHFWGAITLALYGDAVGVFKMLFAINVIEKHLKASLEAAPGYAHGGAHRLLGLIEQKLPGILGGNDDEAKEHFERAIAAAPDEPLNYLFLAELLDDAFDDRKEAIKVVHNGLSQPEPAPDRLESTESRQQLMDLLKKWEKTK
ncbi:MAG: hypothetical protein IT285_08055 [Bdellovibrionales bacterium]|nr:hypothetical protein [Bdellovibrionales bacterium]